MQPGVYLIVGKCSINSSTDYHLGLIAYSKEKVTIKNIVTTGTSITADGMTVTVSNSPWYTSYNLVKLV